MVEFELKIGVFSMNLNFCDAILEELWASYRQGLRPYWERFEEEHLNYIVNIFKEIHW